MSLTPGWTEKSTTHTMGKDIVGDFIRQTDKLYIIDNGSEFKMFPKTQQGWEDLCEELKGFCDL